jgi:hypothetical protein
VAGTVIGADNITVAAVGIPGVANASALTITDGSLVRIELLPWPGPSTVGVTGIAAFTAVAYDAWDNRNTTWAPVWGTTDALGAVGSLGGNATIGFTATYTAGTVPGLDNVTVTAAGNLSVGNATSVQVIPGPLSRLTITPSNAALFPGELANFTAAGFDAFDNPLPPAAFDWNLGAAVGSLNTTVGVSVQFMAGPATGNATLTVSVGPVSDAATLNVLPFPAPSVVLTSPADADHLTGNVTVTYAPSADTITATFDYFDGSVWQPLGADATVDGSFAWDTTGLDRTGATLRVTVANGFGVTALDEAIDLEIDNTPPTITILQPSDLDDVNGSYTITYTTDPDTQLVTFLYLETVWTLIGIDAAPDGTFLWDTTGLQLSGTILRAQAVDEVGLLGSDEASGISVNPAPPNTTTQGPRVDGVPDLVVHFNYTYSFDLTPYVTDPDTPLDDLTAWTSDPGHIWISNDNNLGIEVNYPESLLDTEVEVVVWVGDGTADDFELITIRITDDFPPEIVRPLPDVILDEDTVLTNAFFVNMSFYFLDIDGDNLYFTSGNRSVKVLFHANDTVDIWAEPDWNGIEIVTFRATDPSAAIVEDQVVVQVLPVNDVPVIAPLPPLKVRAGQSTVFDLAPFLSDIDNGLGDLSISTNASRVGVEGLTLKLDYPEDASGGIVWITVSDGDLTAVAPLEVTVVHPSGLPPWVWLAFLPIAPLSAFVFWRRRGGFLAAYLYDDNGDFLRVVKRTKGVPVEPDSIETRSEDGESVNFARQQVGDHLVFFLHTADRHLALVCAPKHEVKARTQGLRLLDQVGSSTPVPETVLAEDPVEEHVYPEEVEPEWSEDFEPWAEEESTEAVAESEIDDPVPEEPVIEEPAVLVSVEGTETVAPAVTLVVGVATGGTRCALCRGRIREGLELSRCSHCQSEYHAPCGDRLEACAACEESFEEEPL